MQERRRRQSSAPLLYFQPHSVQAAFLALHGRKRIPMMVGGNRSGKTTVGGGVCPVSYAYGYWVHRVPGLKLTDTGDYPHRNTVPPEYWIRRADGVPIAHPSRGLLVTGLPAPNGIGEVIWPKLQDLLPTSVRNSGMEVRRGAFSVPVTCTLQNGSFIKFASTYADTISFEGAAYDWVGIDEPIPKEHWNAIWRGATDRFSTVWLTFTPVTSNAVWIHNELVSRADAEALHCTIDQNPHLSEEARRDFKDSSTFPEEERVARVQGGWSFFSFRAFPTFDRTVHVVPHREPERGRFVIQGVDPHHRKPYYMAWAEVGAEGDYYVFREWPEFDFFAARSSPHTVPYYATLIRNLERGEVPDFRRLDPRFGKAAWTVKGEVTTSVQEDFAALGLYFSCDPEGMAVEETGIERIRALLQYDPSYAMGPTNHPRLTVSDRCPNLIKSLLNHAFVDARGEALPEKTREAFKDPADVLRMIVLAPVLSRQFIKSASRGYVSLDDLREYNRSET